MEKRSLRANDCKQENIIKYSDMVYRLAFARSGTRFDADEIYQETFLRYINSDKVFESEEHLKAWLIKVTLNCSKKLMFSPWRRKIQPLDESVVFEEGKDYELYDSLMKLSPKYREVIHLFYYEDMPIEQIGKVLGRKASTVRTQLTRAREQLKSILEKDEGGENIC